MEEDTQKEVVQNREGKVDDYILVKFMPLKSKDPKNYVEKIIEPETDDEDDELIVSFYRQSRKMPGTFVTPVVKDTAPINKTEKCGWN